MSQSSALAAVGDDLNPSLLVVIVDVDPLSWQLRGQFGQQNSIDFNDMVSQLVIFCHAYTLMQRANRILVLANHPNGTSVIYPQPKVQHSFGHTNNLPTVALDDYIPAVHSLQHSLIEGLTTIISAPEGVPVNDAVSGVSSTNKSNITKKSSLAQSLSKALCVINRQLQLLQNLQPRILIIQSSKDESTTYNSIMNSIFSAQKLGVVVDSIVLTKEEDSRFLQQASLLTRGVYQRPIDQKNLLQLMISHCLPSVSTRAMLKAPHQKTVDFRASCFCHQRPVEFAFMCSVCLALTCDAPETQCTTCGTARKRPRTTAAAAAAVVAVVAAAAAAGGGGGKA